MKRYIRASADSNLSAFRKKYSKYYYVVPKDMFEEEFGISFEDSGLPEDGKIPFYEDTYIESWKAKPEYSDVVDEYDVINVVQSPEGELFLGTLAGDRLYDVTEDVDVALEGV